MNTKAKSTLEKLELELRFKNHSDNTVKIYLNYASKFLMCFDNDIYHISQTKAVDFLKAKKFTSISQQNQYISSVKALYKYVVGCEMKKFDVERPRKVKSLPKVIDRDYLVKSIDSIRNTKHKAILTLAYSVGLRVSEVCNMKIADIDSDRMIMIIKNAKGRKDRIAPLTDRVLESLRIYYREHKPTEYLFNGLNSLRYSHASCNKLIKKYLGNNYHFHMLRHSCFTNLTDQGVDIHAIQKLAGHSSPKTTQIYLQVSKHTLSQLPLAM